MEVSWRWCFAPVVLKNGKLLLGALQGEERVLNCLAHPPKIAIISDAICSQRCTGAKMDALAPSLHDEQNKTLRLSVCPKMDSFATCRGLVMLLVVEACFIRCVHEHDCRVAVCPCTGECACASAKNGELWGLVCI
ncbi:hypothetical protein KUCAC02_010795, partial [Chaenocephalus aceratus]